MTQLPRWPLEGATRVLEGPKLKSRCGGIITSRRITRDFADWTVSWEGRREVGRVVGGSGENGNGRVTTGRVGQM